MNRRIALFLGLCSLVTVFTKSAFAQSYACEVTVQNTRTIRSQGHTELVSPVTIDCGGFAPPAGLLATVVLNFTAPVTSKITGPQADKTEAVITPNPPTSPFVEGTNVFFGTRTGASQLTFTNVPIAPPGAGSSSSGNLIVNNVRVDATGLAFGASVNVTASIVSSVSVGITNPSSAAATVQPALASVSASSEFAEQCLNLNRDPAQNPAQPIILVFREAFLGAFKTITNESGLTLSGFTGNPGLATQATILAARLTGVPAGATLWMSSGPTSSFGVSAQIAPEIFTGTQPRYNGTYMRLPVDPSGNALALWEVTSENSGEIDQAAFQVVVEYAANTVTPSAIQATKFLFPGTTTTRIPRFANTSTPSTVFTVTAGCQRLTCSANPLNFIAAGGQLTPPQTASFTTSAGAPFTAVSSLPSITVAPPNGTTAGSLNAASTTNLTATANTAGLNTGVYPGRIVVSASGAECNINTSVTVVAPMIATESDLITFEFDATRTVTPAQRTVLVSSNGGPVPVQVSFSGDDQWINPAPLQFQAPGTFTVRPNAAGLALRDHLGTIRLTTGQGQPAVTTVVRLLYRPTQFTFNPNPLNLSYQLGTSTVPAGTISVTSTPALAFTNLTAVTDDGRNWLRVSSTGTNTPATLNVNVDTNAITQAAGNYGGTISLRGADGVTYSTRVILTVSATGTLVVSPPSLTFNHQIGAANPPIQTVSVTSTAGPISFSASSDQPWLSSSPQSGTTPATLGISVNPANLPAGTHTGNITVTGAGQTATVRVTLVVTQQALITVQPSALAFTFQIGGSNPAAQGLSLTSTQPVNFGLSASTTSGGPWLSLSQAAGQTNATVAVNANPQGLAAGVYQGSIAVTGDGRTQNVPVTLTVTQAGSTTLTATPNPINFFFQFGSATLPTAQTLNLASFTPVSFSITPSSVGNWLSVSQTSGSTQALPGGSPSASVLVSANPLNLPASATPYQGTLTITSPNAPTVVVNVFLTVSGTGGFTVTPSSLSFTSQSGSLPSPQTLTITGVPSGQAVSVSATSAQNFLAASLNSSTLPPTIVVTAQPGALTQGIYNGSIQVTVGGQTQVVPVTLTVLQQQTLTVTPNTLTFNFAPGGPNPAAQTVSVNSVPPAIPFSATASSSNGWLAVSSDSSVTPASLTVTATPGTLPVGTYFGQITVTGGGVTEVVNVTLRIEPFTLTVTPSTLSFTFQPGGDAPAAQSVSVTSVPPGVNFSASSSATWLSAGASGGTTPATLSVSVNPTGLDPGTYNGTITVTAQGQTQTVAVTLTVGTPTLSVNPGSLTFNAILLQDPPAAQSVAVTSVPAGLNFTASVSSNSPWLSIGVSASRTPSTLTVTVNQAGLQPGTYNGTITVTAAGQTASVAVTLVVTGGRITVAPSNIDLTFQAGGTAPESSFAQVTSEPAGLQFSFTNSAPESLSVEASNSTTPATLTLRPNAQLAPGSYTATITVSAAGAVNTPVTLRVNLVVTGPPSIVSISRTSVISGEPGFTLTVNGTNFVDGSQILVNNVAVPTTFVSSTQLTAQIPSSSLTNPGPLTIRVTNPGQVNSGPTTLVVRLAPAQLRLEITGDTGPAQQPRLGVVLSQAQSVPVTGTVSFNFDGRDTTVQFATGGRTANFTIPAGSVRADLPFSNGTVAGNLQFTSRVTSGGSDITPDPVPATTVAVAALPPVLRSATIQRTATGFDVVITGFSTPREMTNINLTFAGNVTPNQIMTNVSAIFTTHYSNTANDQFGSQFELRYPFTGQTTGITSVSVTMSNSRGTSNAVSANF